MPHIYPKAWWVKISSTFEEENMETLSPPRYNTRARARQHSVNSAQQNAPHIFCPIAFTATPGFHFAPQKAYSHIPMANDVINQDTGTSLEYFQLIQYRAIFPVWNKATENECGSLAQGAGGCLEGSSTIFFIPCHAVPKGKVVTYGRFVVDISPDKPEVHRVCLTVGGNLIQYPGDVSTRSTDLATYKCL
jgi:hypothetical protein